MAGAAEGVWLDPESIHPFATDRTIGAIRFKQKKSES